MISLGVTNIDHSVQFYRETPGLQMSGEPDGGIAVFQAGEIMLVLNRPLCAASVGQMAGVVDIIFPA
jgi:hypothetical protein